MASIELTTERAESSYGIPVLLIDGDIVDLDPKSIHYVWVGLVALLKLAGLLQDASRGGREPRTVRALGRCVQVIVDELRKQAA